MLKKNKGNLEKLKKRKKKIQKNLKRKIEGKERKLKSYYIINFRDLIFCLRKPDFSDAGTYYIFIIIISPTTRCRHRVEQSRPARLSLSRSIYLGIKTYLDVIRSGSVNSKGSKRTAENMVYTIFRCEIMYY